MLVSHVNEITGGWLPGILNIQANIYGQLGDQCSSTTPKAIIPGLHIEDPEHSTSHKIVILEDGPSECNFQTRLAPSLLGNSRCIWIEISDLYLVWTHCTNAHVCWDNILASHSWEPCNKFATSRWGLFIESLVCKVDQTSSDHYILWLYSPNDVSCTWYVQAALQRIDNLQNLSVGQSNHPRLQTIYTLFASPHLVSVPKQMSDVDV